MATGDVKLRTDRVTPYFNDDRDVSRFSDHITVWVDQHIGDENTYEGLKAKFEANIQVLRSNNLTEKEMDDDIMLCADQNILNKLSEEVYCLKYFATIDKALSYIYRNQDKKIFFISSGTTGEKIVPHVAELPQIFGVYIFCGYITKHTKWAHDYADCIKAMLDHQDDLLVRLTRDLAEYLERKGDRYKVNDSIIAARNCYVWSLKLYNREKCLGGVGTTRLIENVEKKLMQIQSFSTAVNET